MGKKQAVGQVWPVGCNLPTPAKLNEKRRVQNYTHGMIPYNLKEETYI